MTNISFNTVTLPYLIVIVHCVSLCLKDVSTLSCYNFDIHELILTVFLEEMLLRK